MAFFEWGLEEKRLDFSVICIYFLSLHIRFVYHGFMVTYSTHTFKCFSFFVMYVSY
jgi:hypothetical protein